MSFFKLFSEKEKKKLTCSAINYHCDYEPFEGILNSYFAGRTTLTRCIRGILHHVEITDELHIKENNTLFPLLEDMLQDAEWKTQHDASCGDFDPTNPEWRLSAIPGAYNDAYERISHEEEILTKSSRAADAEAIIKELCRENITADMVINRNILLEKEAELKAIVKNGNLTPYEALLLVKENWHMMYLNRDAYIAIDYILTCSQNVTNPPYADAEIRNIGNTLGTKFQNLRENEK